MDPATTAAVIGGGGMLLGGYLQGQASKEMAEKQMQFQEYMSNTAHQRQVNDLRSAGLNPILSALGNGSSTPAGAMGDAPNLGEGISTGVNTAIAVRQQQKEFEQKDAQIGNTKADTSNKQVEKAILANQASSSAEEVKSKAMQNKILSQTLQSQIQKAKAEGDYAELNQLMGVINSGASSATQLLNPLNWLQKPGKQMRVPKKP